MLSPNKERALQALLTNNSQKEAAKAAGLTTRTLQIYLSDPEFQQEYKKAFGRLVSDATRQAQQALNPAIRTLKTIVEDESEPSGSRISAARTLLEYGLRLTEFTDILQELETVEGE